jgi:hypothetical protein
MMARTQTLVEMVSNLRAEAGHSLSVAQGTNTEQTLRYLLKRTQEELWTAFVWPELRLRMDVAMTSGVYIYSYGTTMKFDAIREAWAAQPSSVRWSKVEYGIGEDKINPGLLTNTASSDPVCLWEAEGDGQFRVWPTPVAGTWLRFKGNQELAPFVADSDKSTLDATCILLFCSAEMLARAKSEDAANKLQKAQRHLSKLLGNQVSAKNKISSYGTGAPSQPARAYPYVLTIGNTP